MEIKLISIADLTTEGFQTRAGLCPAVVKEYTELLKNGGHLPPIRVVREVLSPSPTPQSPVPNPQSPTTKYYLVDGYHRVDSAKRAGRTMLDAEVSDGDRIAALRLALKANSAHGLRRTNADKRNALKMAWEHRQELFGKDDPKDTDLAEVCGVTRMTVYRWKKCNNVTLHSRREGDSSTSNSQSPVPNPQSPSTDRFGVPIPEHLAPAFASPRYRGLVKMLHDVQEGITEELENGNIAFCKVSQSTLITVKNAVEDLKSEMPFCVCRVCSGQGCRACGNTGIQKKSEYDRNPKEIKQ